MPCIVARAEQRQAHEYGAAPHSEPKDDEADQQSYLLARTARQSWTRESHNHGSNDGCADHPNGNQSARQHRAPRDHVSEHDDERQTHDRDGGQTGTENRIKW